MHALNSYDYAVIRVVPHVERGEFINAGVILFCRTRAFLSARIVLDPARLLGLAPDVDPQEVERHLTFFALVSSGDPQAGPIARLPQSGRFHWLVAPRSTIIQTSPVHSGLCQDPEAAIEHLLHTMVLFSPAVRSPDVPDGEGRLTDGTPSSSPR